MRQYQEQNKGADDKLDVNFVSDISPRPFTIPPSGFALAGGIVNSLGYIYPYSLITQVLTYTYGLKYSHLHCNVQLCTVVGA